MDDDQLERARPFAHGRWLRHLTLALAVAAVPTAFLIGRVAEDPPDGSLVVDVVSVAISVTLAVFLLTGVDDRLPPAAHTLIRWVALLVVFYAVTSVAVVVATLAGAT